MMINNRIKYVSTVINTKKKEILTDMMCATCDNNTTYLCVWDKYTFLKKFKCFSL